MQTFRQSQSIVYKWGENLVRLKKPDWREVWQESKKYGKIEGPEKWALIIVLIFVGFFVLI